MNIFFISFQRNSQINDINAIEQIISISLQINSSLCLFFFLFLFFIRSSVSGSFIGTGIFTLHSIN